MIKVPQASRPALWIGRAAPAAKGAVVSSSLRKLHPFDRGHRLLTRAAPIRAATVLALWRARERSPQKASPQVSLLFRSSTLPLRLSVFPETLSASACSASSASGRQAYRPIPQHRSQSGSLFSASPRLLVERR